MLAVLGLLIGFAQPAAATPLSPASSASPASAVAPGTAAPAPATLEPPRLLSDQDVPYPTDGAGDADVLLTITVNADGTVRSARRSPRWSRRPLGRRC